MKMTMGTKVIGLFMVGGIAPLLVSGLISYKNASSSLTEQAMNQLTSVREMKKAELEKYFTNRTADIKTLASSTMTLNALEAFKASFRELGVEKARKLYVFDNPCPAGKRLELIDAMDGSSYSMLHTTYHPHFKYYLEEYDYFYDIFLVDSETGDVVYTVFKEDDFGTNLYTGKYKDTIIGELARAVNASQTNIVRQTDFHFYAPSNNDPARFIAYPILDVTGKRVGILILQLSIEAIDKIMQTRAGLGETGEAYLVGQDKLMRSDSRFSKESTILKLKVDTTAAQEALNNQTGTKIIKDYRGTPVLSAYSPLKTGDITWAIVAEIDEAEALRAAISLRNRMFVIGIIIALGVAGLGYLVTKITGHVTHLLKNLVQELSEGSSHVASASSQISASSQSLAQGTTEQAAAVEETSSSMEEMASMTKRNAEGAREAAQLATLCNKSAEEGGHSMFEMNKAMSEIDQSSKKIGNIIRTIDGIASQTNLLAINAGIEAAKASEQGKGFAVVAEEVRNLAQRSAVAAKETSTLIQESIRKTEAGTDMAKKCTESFQNIVTKIKKMGDLVNEIATASQEQSQGVAQVSQVIQQIDQALRENKYDAEETISIVKQQLYRSQILDTLEEMASMTKQNADHAREAAQLVISCNNSADEGNNSMAEMNKAVSEIDQSSKRIGDIIKTIDSVAFQTNLLALNAAVEAARAGEQGKGFVVVAEEVQNLAQRSAEAAKDTSVLIQESLCKTEAGIDLAKKCTEAFQNIATNVKKVADLVNEIAAASHDQSQGVLQVSKAIQQIDQALQGNAANAEETASASEELFSQSKMLDSFVSKIANEVGGRDGGVRNQESGVGSQRLKMSDSRQQTPVNRFKTHTHDRINQELFGDEVSPTTPKEGFGVRSSMPCRHGVAEFGEKIRTDDFELQTPNLEQSAAVEKTSSSEDNGNKGHDGNEAKDHPPIPPSDTILTHNASISEVWRSVRSTGQSLLQRLRR